MAFNPNIEKDMQRLVRAAEWSRKKLEPFRVHRTDFIRQYVGKEYSDGGASLSVPVNLVELFVNIHTRQLMPTNPRAFVKTKFQALFDQRDKFELGLNHLSVEIDLESTLTKCVFEAMFQMGVVKTGLNVSEKFEWGGVLHDVGQPFADSITLDDWVHDMAVSEWKNIDYCGHRYRAPMDWVKDSGEFIKKNVDDLSPDEVPGQNETSDERADQISRSTGHEEEEIRDHVELMELWIPVENLIVTYHVGSGVGETASAKPLRVQDWDGPETGPYRILRFADVPSQTMPLSPLATLIELHKLNNALWRKSSDQAQNQKTVGAVSKSATIDAQTIMGANDMEVVALDDPNAFVEHRFNGADPATVQMAQLVKSMFSEMGGNLELLGGLAAQSETLGQDKLLAQNANERIKSYQQRVNNLVKGVFQDLGYWLWTDPFIEMPLVKRTQSGQEVEVTFTPEDREGDFQQYNIDINPYSLQSRTPQEEFNLLATIFQGFIFPMRAEMQAQGTTIDFPRLIRHIGDLTNTTFDDFLMYLGRSDVANQAPVGSPPSKTGGPSQKAPAGGHDRGIQEAASMLKMFTGNGKNQTALRN